ncbi:MAG: cytochrome c3 family protein [Candidatus Sulfotelmatobacter sp.]|jgi:predicted CXXCH cytochrome family protein
MRNYSVLAASLVLALVAVVTLPSRAAKKSEYAISSFAKYVQIPGATAAGTETCTTCHADIAKDYRHAFHAQQGVECEQCHGLGSLHVQGGGDVSKIISFKQRSATDANGVCLSCHARDEKIRNWVAGPHASNKVRCTDCHQTHTYTKAGGKTEPGVEMFTDVVTPARVGNVESMVPEAKAMMQPRWQANDACLRCHQSEHGQMSLPYHHPLREGKMSCADCHDPHGGAAGNNLRTANTNQLCLSCHAQYRGPFAYQHPPVTENCMNCHTPHGSANTNLLTVSEPALCLQCHAGHHNGAGLPLADRCTNCHGSIHGTDTPTPSGGSRFVDKGPSDQQLREPQPLRAAAALHGQSAGAATIRLLPSHSPSLAIGAAGGAMGMMSQYLTPMSAANLSGGTDPAEAGANQTDASYSIVPGSYRFVDQTGFGGRVGEYDTLEQSAGADAATAYVSSLNHVTIVSRGNVLSSKDYQAASQLTAGQWARLGFDLRSFMQQQDHYPFYAFPVLDVPPGSTTPPDSTTDLIPSHTTFGVVRRLGKAQAQVKMPRLPIELFVKGDWQARAGVSQLAYLDENTTPAVYVGGVNTTCGAQCHYQSQFQSMNYTTRNIGGGAHADLGPVRLTYEHKYSSFNDRIVPTATFIGPFTPENEGSSVNNPPPYGPAPMDIAAGNYPINIPSPSQSQTDSLNLNWAASPTLSFNGSLSYSRLRDVLTSYPQNGFGSDEVLNWVPTNRLRLTADYHQQNLVNNFTPYYSMFGNVSYHNHWEGLRLEYELGQGFDVEAHYQRNGITRSNSSLWPQVYSMDNTDLQTVVPSSSSNTAGLALRYRDRGPWSARAGYEWTGTHDPGFLIVPQSNNRIFADLTFTPSSLLVFANDLSIIAQNDFRSIALPNTPGAAAGPGFGTDIAGLPPDFERRNRFYIDTTTATLRVLPAWNVGLGYSYQQNNLTTYMAFQNDSSVGYVVEEPTVLYKQLTQAYWGETNYMLRQRLGLNLRLTYNSARSGFRTDLNPNDAALLGNEYLISQGNCDIGAPPPCFSPTMFAAALGNLNFSATQISEVIVPQWIGQSKAYYVFPHKFEGGLLFYYGSYRDYWNPNLNGTLRTFNVYVGRSW